MQASVAYLGTIFYPGGVFCLWPLMDLFNTIFAYGYIILKVPKDAIFAPSDLLRKTVYVLRYLSFVALFLHGAYFSSRAGCGWPFLVRVQTFYNALLVANMTARFFNYCSSSEPKSYARVT